MEKGKPTTERNSRPGNTGLHSRSRVLHLHPFILRAVGVLVLLVWLAGCQVFSPEPTPTLAVPLSPTVGPTPRLLLPTMPPGATLTAMVAAYRGTRTPSAVPPSPTNTPRRTRVPATTPTESPTPISGPSIYVVPELTEPGQPVEVRGADWLPGERIVIRFGTNVEDAGVTGAEGAVRGNGTFATTLTVPEDWAGDNALVVAESVDGRRRAVTRLYLAGPTATASPTLTPTSTQPPPTPTPPPVATPTTQFRRWRGAYYANRTLTGEPELLRDDTLIDFDWGEGAPAAELPVDNFSVRWTRQIDFLTGGYRFNVVVDDGVRVFIDDQLVLDEWEITATTSYEFQRVLSGPTEIRVEYFEAGGNATIRLQWNYLGRFPNWRGAYYNNPTLSGSPTLVRDDIDVDFDWGDGSPAPQIPADNFSVRWTRTAPLSSGTHRFHAQADDGIRVWVDDGLIIDEWHVATGETEYTADTYLSEGRHEIRVEYYEAGGQAQVYVWWENLDAYSAWRGAYFDNRSLAGPPALLRNDFDIDFDWGSGGPDNVDPDDFSVRWTDSRSFARFGVYRFNAEHDDGVRIWVNDELIVDEWYVTGPSTDYGDILLDVGTHDLQVDYFEAGGNASIRVWWEFSPIE